MLDLVGYLQTEKEAFSRSEKRLADLILSDVEAALSSSIVDLAASAEVSPPTVTRFCRRVGCESFSEFKVRLAQSRFVGQRYLQPAEGPKTARDIAQNIINHAQSSLYAFFDAIDPEAIEQAAEKIADANYLLLFGSGGASSMVATEFENRLFRLGLRINSCLDHQAQLMRTAGAPKGTAVIASSMSGNNEQLARTLAIAGEYGMPRIVLTRPGSPVAAEADVLLGIDLPEQPDILRPSSSRYAYLAMIDAVSQTVATRIQTAAVASMRRIKHQLIVTRDGEDSQALGD
ncbi:MurR/RpiR family transcriptional regulator [Paradevosia shaoguanensis]|jgi:DNA-binding MurR/RpiR family transcriptional regulator|uniref:MurR/RpiR family transcriptional regulator n=1 Tax=Paradevosia shaoguanensis TaxID=1335043 RepID=A0AA41QMS2_9HYPH|nr:MurR/RpiR family transcriptional regulator [Paradevosia shaoguanensis]MCF1741883.1 MurR/RpiR family transcriptional regulator [Paradevosia shaoguanensis]MCI0126366.1 MurR/RpiR family transcriptional regulator [Paradevosia shaoguanensis]QMV02743.1 SIS domain-containing protein [Devosia sp. D6-9]CDP49987.1 Transcriptional regulator, RpiR family [Devosia sp. DBB001]